MILRICGGAIFVLVTIGFFSSLSAGETGSGFSIYYGNDSAVLKRIPRSSLVVIDTRALSKSDLEILAVAVRGKKSRVLAYLSIGELHSDEKAAFLKMIKGDFDFRSLVINKNKTFQSFRVDVLSEEWQAWVRSQAGKLLLTQGIDGLFLDTVDTVDVYAEKKNWSLTRRKESIDAMIELVRSLKRKHPDKYILQNGGLNMIGESMFVGNETGIDIRSMALNKNHPDNPDGLLWENAFAGTDPWTNGRLAELRKIQWAGFTKVFALGYQAAYPKRDDFFKKCRDENFTGAWSASSELLHEIPALGPGVTQ